MMNKLIVLLLLVLPFFSFSQNEVDEKLKKKYERTNPPNNEQIIVVPNNPNVILPYNGIYNPYYPYNRYNRYNPYNPYPSRGYYGGSELEFSTGITSGFGKYPYSLGGYFTVGSERSFFIFSYESSQRLPYDRGNKDNRSLWENITRDDAIYWNDEELDRFLKYSSFNIGVGGNLTERWSPFVSVNFYTVDGEFVYYDETGVLESPNNEYTIHDIFEDGINLRFGTFYRINSVQIGSSVTILSPVRVNAHLGFIF